MKKIKGFHLIHQWSKWEYTGLMCNQERHCTCSECGATQERTEHEFGKWNYVEDNCCTQAKVCSRCGVVEYRQQCPNEMIIKEDESLCIETYTCVRCSNVTIKSVDHKFGETMSWIVKNRQNGWLIYNYSLD